MNQSLNNSNCFSEDSAAKVTQFDEASSMKNYNSVVNVKEFKDEFGRTRQSMSNAPLDMPGTRIQSKDTVSKWVNRDTQRDYKDERSQRKRAHRSRSRGRKKRSRSRSRSRDRKRRRSRRTKSRSRSRSRERSYRR